MTIQEKKLMIIGAIEKLETNMVRLEYCEADCEKAMLEKELELDGLRLNWQDARSALVLITKEELGVA